MTRTFLVENSHFEHSNMEQITIYGFELWLFTRSIAGMWNIHHDTNPLEGGGFPFMIQDLQMDSGPLLRTTNKYTQQWRLNAIIVTTRVKQVFVFCKRPS